MRKIEFSEGLFGESVRYECRPLLSAMAGRLNIVYEFERGRSRKCSGKYGRIVMSNINFHSLAVSESLNTL